MDTEDKVGKLLQMKEPFLIWNSLGINISVYKEPLKNDKKNRPTPMVRKANVRGNLVGR